MTTHYNQQIRWEVDDSTALAAQAVGESEVGYYARQLDDDSIWQAIRSGSGATCWRLDESNYRDGLAAVALTDGASVAWDMSQGNVYTLTLGGNRTLAAPTNYVLGKKYYLKVIQDGTGSRTLSWNAVYKAQSDVVVNTTAAAYDTYEILCVSATEFHVFRMDNDVASDTTPQLGGNLDVNSKSIVSTSNGDITLAPNGTGTVVLSATELTTGTDEDLTLAPNGTGNVVISGCSVVTGTNEDLNLTPNGTGLINFMTNHQPYNAEVTLTDGANIATDASLGTLFKVTLGGNRTLDNPTNLVVGAHYSWRIIQDGTGSRTLAFGNYFQFAGGAPTITVTADHYDIIEGYWDGTMLRCTVLADVSA